jgi:hypothetical protein
METANFPSTGLRVVVSINFRFWHLADIANELGDVSF